MATRGLAASLATRVARGHTRMEDGEWRNAEWEWRMAKTNPSPSSILYLSFPSSHRIQRGAVTDADPCGSTSAEALHPTSRAAPTTRARVKSAFMETSERGVWLPAGLGIGHNV